MSIKVQVSSMKAQVALIEEVGLRGDVVGDRARVARALRQLAIRLEDGEMDDALVIEGAPPEVVAIAQEHAPEVQAPVAGLVPGRVVMYRSRVRPYTLPAIVTATAQSLDPIGVARLDVPGLSSASHVHLLVMSPGQQQHYVEHDVPYFDAGGIPVTIRPGTEDGKLEPRMGSWYWPERA